jgi:hypothetical protein
MPVANVYLNGGLGNQLFQLAFLQGFHEKTGSGIALTPPAPNPHSKEEYFETILAKFMGFRRPLPSPVRVLRENPQLQYTNWYRFAKIHPQDTLQFIGYFQRYEYVPASFKDLLVFPTEVANKYPRLHESAFLHIRGGDYLKVPMHHVDLTQYYARAIAFFKARGVSHFYVFTNDVPYAEHFGFLGKEDTTLVQEGEVETLYLMTQCKQGGICANSSFSWWGGYLNAGRSTGNPILLPSRWYTTNEIDTTALYYPGATVITV